MNLSAIFIRRPVMTALVMVSILFFGILAFQTMPVSDLPNVDYPTIQVSVTYPGATPETMANNVASPLEKQFMTINGIQTISSTNSTGSTTIALQFVLSKSMDSAAQDVQAAINQATQQLPQNLPYAPTYSKVNPSATPIMYLALTSPAMNLADLYNYATNIIGERINIIDGVAQVYTYGSAYAVRVRVDPQKLSAKGIGIDDVARVVKSQNINDPTGTLYGKDVEFNILADGQIERAPGYNTIIIKNDDGAIVRVCDVGGAIDSLQNDKYHMRYMSQDTSMETVVLAIQKQPGTNTLQIANAINELLPKIRKYIPASIDIINIFDRSTFIDESVHDVEFTILIAIALVVTVIFLYLGRATNTLIPTLAMPISIVGTFALLSIFGYSIDILSLLAITLSIGFLVDDAIVVLENIVRHVEAGESPLEAALKGSKEISVTVLSMTFSLLSVFIPMLFLGGVLGRLFHEFAITIFIAVLLSGLVSLSLTPMLASRLVPPRNGGDKTRTERLSHRFNNFLLIHYERSLRWVIRRGKIILALGACCLALTIYLFQTLPTDFLPGEDLGFIEGATQTADSSSPFRTIDYQEDLNKTLLKSPYVDRVVSIAGIPEDNEGFFFIKLKPYGKRPRINKVIQELYADLSRLPGMQIFLKPYPLIDLEVGATSSKGDFQYVLQSLSAEDLFHYAPILARRIQLLPGFSQISSDLHPDLPQLKLHILRDRASVLNITATDIENTLGYAFANGNLSTISDPEQQYYVIIEVEPKFYRDPSKLLQLYVRSASSGNLVPLSQIADMEETIGPLSINHTNNLPSVTISFNLQGVPLGPAIESLNDLAKEVLPPTITASVQGTADVFQTSFANLNFLLLITIFVIYVILGILYENLFQPLTVMSTLPPAALGGLLMLVITDTPISLYAFIGLIMLLGIVMKNGIILVDFANSSTEEGKTIDEAILHACRVRFRPILMTTISAMMGAVPIAIGLGGLTAQGRRPLGYVVVGGLLFSQVLTLYLTPVIYIHIEKLREKLHRRAKR